MSYIKERKLNIREIDVPERWRLNLWSEKGKSEVREDERKDILEYHNLVSRIIYSFYLIRENTKRPPGKMYSKPHILYHDKID